MVVVAGTRAPSQRPLPSSTAAVVAGVRGAATRADGGGTRPRHTRARRPSSDRRRPGRPAAPCRAIMVPDAAACYCFEVLEQRLASPATALPSAPPSLPNDR